ncbi:MAG: glycoside-pentoside-hexuronide (GPH):cation symporter [Myxococcota bacterium]|nr:glycoside-pentoside-hexuronide (GPH):cation symporter [Myxococcota bacterium]
MSDEEVGVSPAATGNEKDVFLSWKFIVDFNLPTVGMGFMYLLVNMYLMKYATDVLLIAPAVMGLIFGLSRLLDAITDPLAGFLSDGTRSRMGRRRPWLLYAAIPVALSFYMMWSPPDSFDESDSILYMLIGVILFYSTMTAVFVPHQSLAAEISEDPYQRTRLFGGRHIGWSVGSFIALGAMWLMIRASEPRIAATEIAIAAGTATTLMLFWMVYRVPERKIHQGRGGKNAYRAFADVLRNPHSRVLLLVFLIESVGGAVVNVLTTYVSEYVVGTPDYAPLYILLYALPSAASVPLWVRLAGRYGKKRLWLFSMLVSAICFGSMLFLEEGDVFMISAAALVLGLGSGAGAVVAPSIQADVIDYDELKTGERKEGTYFATWNFVFKLATGFTLVLTGFALDFAGFVPNVEQSESARFALLLLYGAFPMVCFLLGAYIFHRYFNLDEAAHAQIRAELDARSQQEAGSNSH